MLLFSMDSIIELNFTVTLLYIRKTWEDPFTSKVWGGGGGELDGELQEMGESL